MHIENPNFETPIQHMLLKFYQNNPLMISYVWLKLWNSLITQKRFIGIWKCQKTAKNNNFFVFNPTLWVEKKFSRSKVFGNVFLCFSTIMCENYILIGWILQSAKCGHFEPCTPPRSTHEIQIFQVILYLLMEMIFSQIQLPEIFWVGHFKGEGYQCSGPILTYFPRGELWGISFNNTTGFGQQFGKQISLLTKCSRYVSF